ncbi:MAG TPA: amidase [Candidatus Binatia bacterium]|jgi:aspartyl-tRNA(Asn)/glutamyl-tRNA(Gln) amidotransferase subunit A|nr:amidase [Candidatus Binatia bacterium]
MADSKVDRPDTPTPDPSYEPQDRGIDRRSFIVRLGAASAAVAALPPIVARVAHAAPNSGTPFADTVRPEARNDPTECSISEAATLIKSGALKPSTLIGAYLERIATWDADYYQAYNTVLAEQAIADAQRLDRTKYIGPLHGVGLAFKDNYYSAGVLTTANSFIFADFVPEYDCTAIARVKAAGGIMLGKLQMGPLAGGRPTTPDGVITTRNPWAPNNPEVTPSGSSGGSGCATAGRLATCTMGTQTGGSITGPGMSNGITALKPTHGRLSVYGIIPLTITRDHIGPLARDAKDAAIVAQVVGGPDLNDPRTIGLPPMPNLVEAATPVVKKGRVVPRWALRVGVPPGFTTGTTPNAVARVAMLNQLAAIGYEIVDVTLPDEFTLLNSGAFNVSSSERAEMDFKYLKQDVRLFGGRLTGWLPSIVQGGAEVAKGLRTRLLLLDRCMTQMFNQCDVIMQTGSNFDGIGLPLCTFAIGFAPNAQGITLPLATSVGGPPFSEESILSVIAAYQATTTFHFERPADPVVGVSAASRTRGTRITCRDVDLECRAAMEGTVLG